MNPSHSKVAKVVADLHGFLDRSGVVALDEGLAIGTSVRGVEIVLSYKQARRLADMGTPIGGPPEVASSGINPVSSDINAESTGGLWQEMLDQTKDAPPSTESIQGPPLQPHPEDVDRLDPDERAKVENVRGWVQELARAFVEDGVEIPTKLALAMMDAGGLVRIFDRHMPPVGEPNG